MKKTSMHAAAQDAEIEKFVDQLVKEKGMSDLEPVILEQVKSDVAERVEEHVNAEILAHMPEDKVGRLNELLDAGDMDAVGQFIGENVENLQQVIVDTLVQFRKTYLGL